MSTFNGHQSFIVLFGSLSLFAFDLFFFRIIQTLFQPDLFGHPVKINLLMTKICPLPLTYSAAVNFQFAIFFLRFYGPSVAEPKNLNTREIFDLIKSTCQFTIIPISIQLRSIHPSLKTIIKSAKFQKFHFFINSKVMIFSADCL